MSMILSLSLGFLIATFVHADIGALKTRLNEMAISGALVAGEFRPYKDHFINHGADGIICYGERAFDEKLVALKFVVNKETSEREFEMYSYLQAMERPDSLEKFGFADVHYYTEWDGYYLLVLSYFDGGYLSSKSKKPFFKTDVGNDTINGLLLFRNFVRQSKYMHSRGIRHDDIKPNNIMLHVNQSFLINFNSGSRMYEDNHFGTPKYASRAYHKGTIRTAIDDYESFLYTMCDLYDIQLPWFSRDFSNDVYSEFKNMTDTIITTIRTSIKSFHLRHVFLEFANEIFTKKHTLPYPDYDHLDKLISEQIPKVLKPMQYQMFSWITPEQQFLEAQKLQFKSKLNIEKDIKFPKSLDFKTFKYPAVNTKHFTEVNFVKSVSVMFKSCVEGSMPAYKNLKTQSLKL